MIKKEKQHAIVTLLITGLTFGILCLAAWFHTPNQISVSERRRLAQLPALTKDSVGKGNFMSGFERYSQDQFPFREAKNESTVFFVSAKRCSWNLCCRRLCSINRKRNQ